MSDPGEIAVAKERAAHELAPIDAAYAAGEIDEATWHARVGEIVEAGYLTAATPQGQSGHSGDDARWEHARRLVLDAVERRGTLLDVGCANGLLMESVHRWSQEDGRALEPYGVEISAPLADLARTRCPQWADRIWTANANGWTPPPRVDVVRTGLDYVPADRGADYVRPLLTAVVAPGGRLVVGTYNEERDRDTLADLVRSWGYVVVGSTTREHRHPALAYKAFWVDSEPPGS